MTHENHQRSSQKTKEIGFPTRSPDDEFASVCEQFPGFSYKQRRMCQNHVDNIIAVRQGALLAITECQYQFERRRWNCTIVDPVNVFGRVVATGKTACQIIIYDINGRQITELQLTENRTPKMISLSLINSGIYFYKAISGDKVVQNKLVIIK